MKSIYLIFAFLALAQAIPLSIGYRCACSEYKQLDLCLNMNYCSWVNDMCVDLQCYLQLQEDCIAAKTMYKCGWNSLTNVCESKSYTCNDIILQNNCKSQYGLDCFWQSNTNKCIDFICTGDSDQCNWNRCSNASGVCGDPQSVDCSTLTATDCTNGVYGGDGKICMTNDSGLCKQYNISALNCSEYDDKAPQDCTYDYTTKTCNQNSCSKNSQSNCSIIIDYNAFSVTLCHWNGTACQDTTDADIQSYNYETCLFETLQNYAWNADSFQCLRCIDLVVNPIYNTNKSSTIIDNNSILIMIFPLLL